ncbi:tRNA glutamyl-Q synthetase [Chitinophaga alhagiae]|uniref:tRNA glutamyl-Q synthetase n=1 Tax=Chitinophaga alhagiae TaxID=2203219 RepID=A0ABN5LRQ1_9BACT|nr:glutamate--tRNA ligase family protein [Chitinophaga alhagiae]AWO02058.1 tRNA glutamyl-Q synthetase [Chitinophaga alhagiae]
MEQQRTFSKTRIAPTPSGFLHLGNVFSFAVTAALARQTNAGILLRIDDLDQQRAEKDYVEDIFDTLRFLDIPWTEGPSGYGEFQARYSQVHRMPLYNAALEHLKEHVFACNCSRTQITRASLDGGYPGTCRHKNIPLSTPGAAWRLRTHHEQPLLVRTLSGTITEAVLPADMRDFVVRKKDGYPAYQLASVIDDQHFGIDLVVRGQDLWPSTLAQLYLSALLPGSRFADCVFYHHPLLLETSDQKMSKSAGATSVQYWKKQGKAPRDIYTMIAGRLRPGAVAGSFEDLTGLLPEAGTVL